MISRVAGESGGRAIQDKTAPHGSGGLRLVLALYGILGLGYSLLMPMWEAPDEPDHYGVALYIARENQSPPPDYNVESKQPSLYYWLASVPLRVLDRIDPGLVDDYSPTLRPYGHVPRVAWNRANHRFVWGAMALRWFNLLLGAGSLALVFYGIRRLCPEPAAQSLAAISLMGLTPQFLHISASAGNDAIATLAGAYLWFLLCRVISESEHASLSVLSLTVGSTLPFITKLSALPMGLTLVAAVLWTGRSRWRDLTAKRMFVALLVVACLSIGVIEFAGTFVSNLWNDIRWRTFSVRPDAFEFIHQLPKQLTLSYWGLVGWMSLPLPSPLPLWLNAFAAAGAVGSLRLLLGDAASDSTRRAAIAATVLIAAGAAWYNTWFAAVWAAVVIYALFRSTLRERPVVFRRAGAWGFVWLCIFLSAAAIGKNWMADAQAQGRFLFPSMGAISLIVTSGWISLLPERTIRALPYWIMGVLAVVNLAFWFTAIIPVYYQPWLG